MPTRRTHFLPSGPRKESLASQGLYHENPRNSTIWIPIWDIDEQAGLFNTQGNTDYLITEYCLSRRNNERAAFVGNTVGIDGGRSGLG